MDRIFKRKEGLPWQTLNGETIVIEPRTQISHEINEVGSLVWELLDGQRDLRCLCDKVKEVFEEEENIIHQDVSDFLHELLSKGLVTC